MMSLKRLILVWLSLFSLIATAEDFGPVSIEVVPPMSRIFSLHGYRVHELRMRNRELKPVEVRFLLKLRGSEQIQVERTVLLAPAATAHTFLFHPRPSGYFHAEPLAVFIDGRSVKQTLRLDYRAANSTSLFSPSLPIQDYRELLFIADNAEVTSVSIPQWGRQLRDYIGFSQIYLSSEDRLPPEVAEPIIQWVQLGGNLLICVPPDASWPENVPLPLPGGDDIFQKHLSWGQIVYCRPIIAADQKKVEDFLANKRASEPKRRNKNSEDPPPLELGLAADFLRGQQAIEKRGPDMDPLGLMTDVMNVPLHLLFFVMLFFAILIGPVNFWVLKRYKKEPWILVTTPLISLFFCGVVIVFITFKEGWYSRGRAVAVTLLDQTKQQAVTKGWMAVYAPIAPRGGFDFPMEDCLAFWNNGEFTLNLDSSQHFNSRLLQPRIPLGYSFKQVRVRHERLQLQGVENGQMRLVNGLGGTLTDLAVVGTDRNIYLSQQPVAAGASIMIPASGVTTIHTFQAERLGEEFRRSLPNKVHFMALAERLPPGYYVAKASAPLFFSPGVTPQEFRVEQYIIGKYDSIGKENHGN